MSDLVKHIKEIAGIEVDTETYLKHRTLDALTECRGISNTTRFLYRLNNAGELQDVIVAGYGNLNEIDKTCPTHSPNSAFFKLQFYAVTKNVPLVNWLGSTRALDSAIEEIRHHSSFDKRYLNGNRVEDKHVMLAASSNDKAGIQFSSLATNVHKNGSSYIGDLVLSVTKNLGRGSQYLSDSQSQNVETLKTLDILSEKDNKTGELFYNPFQTGVLKSKRQIQLFTDTFKINPDYNIWILTANNNV